MTKHLEEALGILSEDDEIEELSQEMTPTEILEETAEIINALSMTDKVDSALTTVDGLHEHDDDMDVIARRAMEAFETVFTLGLNSPATKEAGSILSAAKDLLKTALDAKDSKANAKLRIIDLQIRKMKADVDSGNADVGEGLDHRAMVEYIRKSVHGDGVMVEKDEESDK